MRAGTENGPGLAGFGAAVNTGQVGRGDSVAVIGCGGVGNAAIAGAHIAGATTVVAVDVDARKLEAAKGFGATHTVDASTEDAVDLARQLQIHPAIIAGRVRKETENWRLLSNLISSAGKVSDLFNNQLACQ